MSSFPDKLRTSWQLLGHSLRVIQKNPKLFLFPVVSTLCGMAIFLFFFAPILAVMFAGVWSGAAAATHADWREIGARYNLAMYLYGVALYLTSMFVATFMNVAFYNEIIRALAGEPVSLGHGLRFAGRRVRAILLWSLLAGTVGLIIRTVEERLGWIGRIVLAAVGTAWSVAAVFAIPVIIRRADSNPLAVLRDSVATLKRTWGESLAGFLGIQFGGLALVAATVLAMLVVATVLHLFWFGLLMGLVELLAIFAAGFLLSMATHVYRCALYVYASEGVVPEPYTTEMMNAGWKVKKA